VGRGGQANASLVVTSDHPIRLRNQSDPAPTGQINTYISADPNSTTQSTLRASTATTDCHDQRHG